MKKSLFDYPDPFALAPLTALLPVTGSISSLPGLASSLFARYEKVQAFRSELGDDADRNVARRLMAEEEMLKQVLDWLAVTSQAGGTSGSGSMEGGR